MAKQERCVWVVGHKNPDTDSICAAISYAYLKNQTEDGHFIAKRAGSINNETRYVLERQWSFLVEKGMGTHAFSGCCYPAGRG